MNARSRILASLALALTALTTQANPLPQEGPVDLAALKSYLKHGPKTTLTASETYEKKAAELDTLYGYRPGRAPLMKRTADTLRARGDVTPEEIKEWKGLLEADFERIIWFDRAMWTLEAKLLPEQIDRNAYMLGIRTAAEREAFSGTLCALAAIDLRSEAGKQRYAAGVNPLLRDSGNLHKGIIAKLRAHGLRNDVSFEDVP